MNIKFVGLSLVILFLASCINHYESNNIVESKDSTKKDSFLICFETNITKRYGAAYDSSLKITESGDKSTLGMAAIPAGTFMMGADNEQASKDKYPKN